MTKRLSLCFLAVAVLCTSGCLFHRKSSKPKESSALASEVEQEFKTRWVGKRVSELNAQGVTGAAAQQQAEQEFAEKFNFSKKSK